MHKKNRIKAGAISLFLVVALVLSTVFVAKETNHHCTHENCQICSCLSLCKKVVNELSSGLVVLFGFTGRMIWILLAIGYIASTFIYDTLVNLKVKLTI